MIIPIEQAREVLRLDGSDNDYVIVPLINAIPDYLQVSTGYHFNGGQPHPLAETAAKFILRLWYDPDGYDREQLQRTINNLLTALTAAINHVG
jgi:hypothetical protein